MKPTLLILAAGMGSRYGKLKQMDSFGPNGETIIEYSIYDAIAAGFGKLVFIVRDSFKTEFETYFRSKLDGKIDMEFVSQELNIIPDGMSYTEERQKPWGTAHAIWVAKNVINEPFGVINADDYYGVEAYSQLASFLTDQQNNKDFAVVAYYLRNTLSDHGTVNRGVCTLNEEGHLIDVKECVKIKPNYTLFVPNSFTPNGDGLNDLFLPLAQSVKEYDLTIYNRWGLKVYNSQQLELGWDGGSEPQGAFNYVIQVTTLAGEQKIYTGSVTLYR